MRSGGSPNRLVKAARIYRVPYPTREGYTTDGPPRFYLARGDRRRFIAVDANDKIWSMSRRCGVKTKEFSNRLGDPKDLPSAEESQRFFEGIPAPEQGPRQELFRISR
jgi:hypothetical protein